MNIQKPNSLGAIDRATLVHPYTDLAAHDEKGPHIITKGNGVFMEDEDGRRYLDALAGLWCMSLGFGEDRLIEAATRQMKELAYHHSFAHRSHPAVIEYHGVTIASGSLTALPYKQVDFDLPVNDRFLKVSCPHFYRYGMPGESEAEFAARLVEEVDQRIMDEGPETVAAFIGEPVMAAGGVIPPPEGYWPGVAQVCRKHDVLLVCDEVVNGFGRTGNMWGSQTVGVEPDIMTTAKQLSSAYLPIGATLMSEAVYDVIAQNSAKYGTFGVGMTYGGHPVCAAVALETLKIYEEMDIVDRVRAIAPVFQRRFDALAEHPGAVELVADKESREQFAPERGAAKHLFAQVQEQGVIGRP